jgi:hypothetical protein
VSFNYVFNISSSVPSEQEVISLSLSIPPSSIRIVSFYWNDLIEPHLPSSAPIQITILFKPKLKGICQCIVDEGSSTIILSSLT